MADVEYQPSALYAPAYPEAARRGGMEGKCTVFVDVDEAGKPIAARNDDCAEWFYDAAKKAAMESTFVPRDTLRGVLTRTYTVAYPFTRDPGFGHDWVVSVLGDASGFCLHCATGGITAEDAVLFGFGRSYEGFLWTTDVGIRNGGFEIGGDATEQIFWQDTFTPLVGLKGTFIFGEPAEHAGLTSGTPDDPTYYSAAVTGGFSLQPHSQHWVLSLFAGGDFRFGWKYYRELRPVGGVRLEWHFPPPGSTVALIRRNTPHIIDESDAFVLDPERRPPPLEPPPQPVAFTAATVLFWADPVYPELAAHLGVEGTCTATLDLGADGTPISAAATACPPFFAAAVEDAAMQSRIAPYPDPATGLPIGIELDYGYEFRQGATGATVLRTSPGTVTSAPTSPGTVGWTPSALAPARVVTLPPDPGGPPPRRPASVPGVDPGEKVRPEGVEQLAPPPGSSALIAAETPRLVSWAAVHEKNRVIPTYPDAAVARNIEGDCVVVITVGIDGVPLHVDVRACDPIFRDTSVEAALESRFYPYISAGQEIEVSFTYKYHFRQAPPPKKKRGFFAGKE